jgi:hypothetical protein
MFCTSAAPIEAQTSGSWPAGGSPVQWSNVKMCRSDPRSARFRQGVLHIRQVLECGSPLQAPQSPACLYQLAAYDPIAFHQVSYALSDRNLHMVGAEFA